MSTKKSRVHTEHKMKEHEETKVHKEKKVKSVVVKKVKPKILADAPQEHIFMLCNGVPVTNVKGLADILETLEDEVFNHHVKFDRNDFANWIKDIFEDVELAAKIADVKDKNHMRLVLYKHMVDKLVK